MQFRAKRVTAGAGYTFLDATYRTAETVTGSANSTNDAALAGLNTFLDPKKRAAEHYRAANAYAVVRDEARYLLARTARRNGKRGVEATADHDSEKPCAERRRKTAER